MSPVGTEAAGAVAEMSAEIKAAPVVSRADRRRLHRQIRRGSRPGKRQQAEPDAGGGALPWSEGAVHRAGFFGASVVTFIIRFADVSPPKELPK